MQVTGLIHDLGKLLYFYGESQWSTVGDTFIIGAEFSDKNIYPETCTYHSPIFHAKLTFSQSKPTPITPTQS